MKNKTQTQNKLTPFSDAERFKHEVDLELFLEKAGAVRKYRTGNFYVPWRETPGENKTPSLSVRYYPERGWIWRDWGTDEYGDIFDLVEKMYGISDFREQIRKILDVWYGSGSQNQYQIQKQYQKLQTIQNIQQAHKKPVIRWFQTSDSQAVAKAIAYLRDERNIPELTIKIAMAANLILAFAIFKLYQISKDRYEKKKIGYGVGCANLSNGYNARSLQKNYKHATIQDITTFFFDRINQKIYANYNSFQHLNKAKKIVVCESVIDCLSAAEFLNDDYTFFISLNSTTNVNRLCSFLRKYANDQQIVCMLDNDTAGNKATQEIQNFCQNHGLNFQDYRFIYSNFKDPNDFLQHMRKPQNPQLNPDMEKDMEKELNRIIRKHGYDPARAPEPF